MYHDTAVRVDDTITPVLCTADKTERYGGSLTTSSTRRVDPSSSLLPPPLARTAHTYARDYEFSLDSSIDRVLSLVKIEQGAGGCVEWRCCCLQEAGGAHTQEYLAHWSMLPLLCRFFSMWTGVLKCIRFDTTPAVLLYHIYIKKQIYDFFRNLYLPKIVERQNILLLQQ